MSQLPRVSIIAINFNTLDDTVIFLQSVRDLTYPNLEVILVDNASREDPNKIITSQFPEVNYIRSDVNLGFAGGNNLGIKASSGEYLFLLNNDTILPSGFVEPIIAFMEKHPEIGMASPKIVFPDGKLQYVGSVGISPLTAKGKRKNFREEDKGQFDRCYKTDLAHGAALIVPRKIIDEVGAMPEEYFLYYEEHDWCEQVKRAGYDIYYIGLSKIVHKQSASTGAKSPLKTYYLTRNRILFLRRNFKGIPLTIGLLYFTLIAAPLNMLRHLVKGEIKLLSAYFKGIIWNFKNSPI